jgi:hypothetical protein
VTSIPSLDHLPPEHLRALAMQLIQRVETMHKKINRDQAVIENLTHEVVQLKRLAFASRFSEKAHRTQKGGQREPDKIIR